MTTSSGGTPWKGSYQVVMLLYRKWQNRVIFFKKYTCHENMHKISDSLFLLLVLSCGKNALFKTGHKQSGKEVLLHVYVYIYACLCVQICLYQWAARCVDHERAWTHYLIEIPFSFSIKTTWILFAWDFKLPTLDFFCNSNCGKELLSFCIDD